MASSIGPVNQLVAVIKSQLSKAGAARKTATGPRKKSAVTAPTGGRDLGALIALRVKEIGADDPQRGRKAFRVFLEAVLLSQFGEHLINDPLFHQLVGDVQDGLDADPQTRTMVASAIDELLKQSSKQ